jgi:hypothetical protein
MITVVSKNDVLNITPLKEHLDGNELNANDETVKTGAQLTEIET